MNQAEFHPHLSSALVQSGPRHNEAGFRSPEYLGHVLKIVRPKTVRVSTTAVALIGPCSKQE
jgi:hypothetical protein